MEIVEFRICNFRSILDTGWRNFSPDKVTVLIGQNESGKTSILEAISKTFGPEDITDDDIRIDNPLPEVILRIKLGDDDINGMCNYLLREEDCNSSQVEALKLYLQGYKNLIELQFSWKKSSDGQYEKEFIINNDDLKSYCEELITKYESEEVDEEADEEIEEDSEEEPSENGEVGENLDVVIISEALYEVSPNIILFNHETGLLPNEINIKRKDDGNIYLSGKGGNAALNFLKVAQLKLETLIASDSRTRATLLSRANAKITEDFTKFWSQTIGKKEKLKLECEIETYGADAGEKAGKKYLVFWVSDGHRKLYPKQRSKGVQWFVSFYLQLKASEITSDDRFFLLDEPGANLHSKAQTDVIKLINELSRFIPIMYSTHIPHMLEYDKFSRVLAVQRVGDKEDSPTEVITAHCLGTASSDTLSPILTVMGSDLSNQEVIRKTNNVLLEEMSGFYYLKAFWELTNEEQDAHFIATTGVNKIPQFANMFLGWGLEYIVVVDDDKSGRGVYNSLKREIFADDAELAMNNMYKIKNCEGIEDIFSEADFKKYVLNDAKVTVQNKNTEHIKSEGISKPVLAYKFLMNTRDGKLKFNDFSEPTKTKINELICEIKSRLMAKNDN